MSVNIEDLTPERIDALKQMVKHGNGVAVVDMAEMRALIAQAERAAVAEARVAELEQTLATIRLRNLRNMLVYDAKNEEIARLRQELADADNDLSALRSPAPPTRADLAQVAPAAPSGEREAVTWPVKARRLLDAAQQMTIAIGMGWDLDGAIEGLREQVDAVEKLGVKPSQDHYPAALDRARAGSESGHG